MDVSVAYFKFIIFFRHFYFVSLFIFEHINDYMLSHTQPRIFVYSPFRSFDQ